MESIYSDLSVSITELKKNPSSVIEQANGEPVAILNHNKPAAYLVPAALFEYLMEINEEAMDAELVRNRINGEFVEVKLDDL